MKRDNTIIVSREWKYKLYYDDPLGSEKKFAKQKKTMKWNNKTKLFLLSHCIAKHQLVVLRYMQIHSR